MKVVAIIQARMGSTRLPSKVMKKIVDKTVLEHVVDRVKQSAEIDEIVIATTTKEADDAIVKESERLGVKNFRGSEDDVLSRYYYAAKENGADIIVRITSDCPLISPEVIDQIIAEFKSNEYDYLSNTIKRTYPRGLDCEVLSFGILKKVFDEAFEKHQREHVTPYIYENPAIFRIYQYMDNEDNSDLRCTLDTTEDYEAINKMIEALKLNYNYRDMIKFLRNNPDIVNINREINQKELRG